MIELCSYFCDDFFIATLRNGTKKCYKCGNVEPLKHWGWHIRGKDAADRTQEAVEIRKKLREEGDPRYTSQDYLRHLGEEWDRRLR